MIEVSISEAFFIYLFISMTFVFILWALSEYRSRTRAVKVEVEETMVCEICLQSFVFNKHESIVKCTHCGSLNDVISG